MHHESPKGTPIVRIMEGPFKGFEGPVVGIDQHKSTVRVRISRNGVVFGPKDTTVELDVRQVRRINV